MDHFGMWGIIPPVLTIALAFITKDVIVSLFLGILSGCLIVAGGNPAVALMKLTDLLAGSLADGVSFYSADYSAHWSACCQKRERHRPLDYGCPKN